MLDVQKGRDAMRLDLFRRGRPLCLPSAMIMKRTQMSAAGVQGGQTRRSAPTGDIRVFFINCLQPNLLNDYSVVYLRNKPCRRVSRLPAYPPHHSNLSPVPTLDRKPHTKLGRVRIGQTESRNNQDRCFLASVDK
jgi:hypothetical protein